ncbi:MAG: sigma-70 family RNA polymerase sigma factor [Lachnospiraceae bacterium]|nr:sigma-70 family RNA polymerase sigma factor [Lachnospiraceae bacterium]
MEKVLDNYQKYYRLAYSYVHNESDALDIVQEGAYKAILNSHTLKKREFMETWIYRIMMNEAVLFIRKNRRSEFVSLDELELRAKEDQYEDIDLARALDQLGEPEGTIIRLRFFEDMKLEDIAEIVGENLNTVKTKLYRTLKVLRISLETN